MKPRVLVLSGCGINCERETAWAFGMPGVGGEATCVHVNDLIAQPDRLDAFHVMVIPAASPLATTSPPVSCSPPGCATGWRSP